MQIYFESWIKEQDISEDAELLFEEAIKCYRVGAYRASFLMSYLGFMKSLRDRLLRSDKPDLVHEEDWRKTRNDLKDDKIWEDTVYKTTQEKQVRLCKVYLINNDLIEEIPYWRKKRNESAHAKDTILGYSHVETFWLFLQSNLSKFVVNGGEKALLAKIEKHFDKKYTEPGTDFSYLINEIPLVVKKDGVSNLLKVINDDYVELQFYGDRQGYLFWKSIAYSSNDDLNKSFIEYITSDSEVFVEFMEAFPDRLLLCTHNSELIRLFWKELIFKKISSYSDSFWELSLILLRNALIPDPEVVQFVRRLSASINSGRLPSEEQTVLLKRYGIFEEIKESIFVSGILNKLHVGYQNANNSATKIIYYLRNMSLDIEVVRELNILFKTYTFGSLFDSIEKFMGGNSEFKYRFIEIAESNGLELAEFFSLAVTEDIDKE
ncbi:hypothetical protein [Sporosarcina gallistercoris]|uniref:Uncharacterized protein n=1 Tax=Sporosarcina gallistercoris TaxID=2762245 RepID=A0ABR8PL56_9BACL|nr:hypothetical protein [Sporosarcina gallistercoris]MBD7908903.1 hypothetical protein [Sporosarcina gallistercoris]